MTHTIMDNAGIKNAKWNYMLASQLPQLDEFCTRVIDQLGFPIFVKPANAGSSVGITKATDYQSLRDGIKLAFTHDKKIVVEEMIVGKEVECAVLGNETPQASIPGEIISCNDFYDYEAKYIADSKLQIPADLDEDTTNRLREIAVKAYKAWGCSGMARVDFFVTDQNEIYLNEPNTLPGFTSISMYPKMWEATGLPYGELLSQLIELAIERA